jgi:hypothetical protein
LHIVEQSAAIALGELSKGTDTESLDVLINLKFDPDPDVVQSVVQSIAQIVVGKKLEDGTLASFVGVSPAKNTKRLPSATRRLHPLPPRPLVTREWMDKVKDVDGDGWHAYVYWSQCVRGVAGKPPCARAMKYIMDVKDAVDALGIPGWIYTLKSLVCIHESLRVCEYILCSIVCKRTHAYVGARFGGDERQRNEKAESRHGAQDAN